MSRSSRRIVCSSEHWGSRIAQLGLALLCAQSVVVANMAAVQISFAVTGARFAGASHC